LLKLDDCIGSLDEGKNADLVVVNGNPMDDVAVLRARTKSVALFSMGRQCWTVIRADSWLARDFRLHEMNVPDDAQHDTAAHCDSKPGGPRANSQCGNRLHFQQIFLL